MPGFVQDAYEELTQAVSEGPSGAQDAAHNRRLLPMPSISPVLRSSLEWSCWQAVISSHTQKFATLSDSARARLPMPVTLSTSPELRAEVCRSRQTGTRKPTDACRLLSEDAVPQSAAAST
ncbi:unnamed protein product [Cercospora beticola]|nr:unnamed protein product [Cercospora beticola]